MIDVARKEKETLSAMFKEKKAEIMAMEHEIKAKITQKNAIVDEIKSLTSNLGLMQKEFTRAQSALSGVQIEAKKTIEEASRKIANAIELEKKAEILVRQRQLELNVLGREKGIIENVKRQSIRNAELEKRLFEKNMELDSKIAEYNEFIKQNSEVSALKVQIEKDRKELEKTISENEAKSKELSNLIKQNTAERGRLQSEMTRYNKSNVRIEQLQSDLAIQIDNQREGYVSVDTERQKLKETNDKTIAVLETRRRIIEGREKRLDSILELIKKDKKYDDNLKEVGLL